LEVLGFPWEKNVDIMSVASQYGLKESFPMECIKEVSALPDSVSAKDLIGRKDFTGIKCFTIDGEDARDFDDAVSVRANNDGTFSLGVHIADVSHYVTENSATDKEAYERGTSVYFPELVIPMLPTKLSNGLCSLNEKQKRLTLSVTMKINKKGDVVDYEIDKGVISSCHRLTYTEVFAMMTGDKVVRDKYSDIISDIDTMDALAKVLENKRNKRGNIDFQKSEVKFVMDEKGDVVDILPYERNSAHKLIEEFMIIANETVAQYVYNLSLPFVYRVHEKPDSEKMDILMELLKGLGIAVKEKADKIHSSTLQSALREAENTPYFDLVNKVMLRTMQKAKYSPINIGHFGLSSECYCHFTSPIRRYPDLIVHRILSAVLFGKMEEQACKHFDIVCSEGSVQSSIRERVADEAERTVDDLKKCQYAVKYIGESFTGLVSGVAEFGIFVELSNTVEGLVRVENLVGDNYSFNEKKFTLSNGAKTYSLGDKIDVTISSVNVSARKIDFSLKNLD
ncbi:MAG: ribonuclease R, partial [Clostridia bacterium]